MTPKNLSPYELWQLERYGNVLPSIGRDQEPEGTDQPLPTSEENYIFELENPES